MRLFFTLTSLFAICVLADTTARSFAEVHDRVALISDQEHGVLRVMIDGREAARFDAGGLQVRQSIEYGGVLTDTGTEYYDQHPQGDSGQ